MKFSIDVCTRARYVGFNWDKKNAYLTREKNEIEKFFWYFILDLYRRKIIKEGAKLTKYDSYEQFFEIDDRRLEDKDYRAIFENVSYLVMRF